MAETSYSQRNSQFNLFHDAGASIDDLSYQIPIKYQYWSTGAMVNFHFYKGFYIGVGGAFLLNTAKNQIFYQSNQNEKYNDAETQRTLRESFFGLNSFEWMGELGYVHKSGLGIGVRYRQSTSDMIETRENKYDYLEYKNSLEYISAQIYYWIPLMQ